MTRDLQCFDCWLWEPIGAKCHRHGNEADHAKRLAAAGLQPCVHGRTDYRHCPHCMGFAVNGDIAI